ncbi:hypothetical protein PIB30_059387 [Stylosanthes scabra]|uniref:Uncharacterized protein n=1 Tax=Stylosanthes scabra TaxID=79078 RepID=A0ABU6SKC0_9FABA|nr:hypothetical protein [Stylosanthes scabra]
METQLQFDDDTFYAEIRRQILLLTSEDNEELEEARRFDSVRVAKSGSTRSSVYYKSEWQGSSNSNFCSWETGSTNGSPPDWLLNLWKNGKGTGVFIPQAVTYSRKQRQGTMNSSRRRVYRSMMNKDRRI